MSNTETIDPALRPREWDEYVGQEPIKHRLDVRIQAAVATNQPLDHVFISGPPGTGKTTLAQIIASKLGDPLLAITKPMTSKDFQRALYKHSAGVVLIDEIHRLSRSAQEDLLPLLEDGVWESARGGGRIEFKFLTIIGATTDPEKVIEPLLDRFMIRERITDYDDAQLALIVQGMGQRAGLEIDDESAAVLGRASGGVPRHARRFVNAWRDLATVNLCDPEPEDVVAFCDGELDGLTREQVDLLDQLDRLGGIAGMDLLAAQLRLHPKEIVTAERLLIQRGYLIRESTGRILTGDGRDRVAQNRPAQTTRRGSR